PSDVRVDGADRTTEGNRRDGAGRVRPDARQPLEGFDVVRHAAVVIVSDCLRRPPEVECPAVVAHALPCPEDVRRRGRGQRVDRREPGDEPRPGLDDHLLSDEAARDDPKLEGWSTLAALAAVTTRARLGLLVAANTFRNPGLTAKLATTVDHVSGGRLILGLGGGWFEDEHRAFGLDFGSGLGGRLDRLAEAVPLIRRLLRGGRVTAAGRF